MYTNIYICSNEEHMGLKTTLSVQIHDQAFLVHLIKSIPSSYRSINLNLNVHACRIWISLITSAPSLSLLVICRLLLFCLKRKCRFKRPGASGSACCLWTERSQVRAVASTHCTVCGKDLPLITSPRPRTVREPMALGTSFFLESVGSRCSETPHCIPQTHFFVMIFGTVGANNEYHHLEPHLVSIAFI